MTTATRPVSAPPSPGEPAAGRVLDTHWQTRTVAAVIVGAAAIGIWQPQLGGGVLWGVPVLAFAILVMIRAIQPATQLQGLVLMFSWIGWIPLAVLLAGAPPGALAPGQLLAGCATLLRGASSPLGLAAWLAFSGACWITGATQSIRPGRAAAASGFVFLALPFVAAFAVSRTGDAAWYGGAILAAALLWATRGTLRGALPATLAVAVAGTLVAMVAGPTDRRIPQRQAAAPTGGAGGIGQSNDDQGQADGQNGANAQPRPAEQTILDPRQEYGPIEQDGTPTLSFEVRSDAPSLWRMLVLDRWDGRGWSVGEATRPLPQPAAKSVLSRITMRSLRETRAFAPGRIARVSGDSPAAPTVGESQTFAEAPSPGSTYRVRSERVATDVAALRRAPLPDPGRYPAETLVWPSLPASIPLAQRSAQLPEDAARSGWGDVYALAARLSRGQVTEFGVVSSVLDYLRDPAHFSYSLDVKPAGPQPLVTFLLDSHVGYCQHFAGAAALLLRIAGIPARVVTGYATGEEAGDRFLVQSTDAHAWIEVYFEGYGWVPFNPTPGAAAADVAASVDPTAPPRPAQASRANLKQIAEAVLALLLLAAAAQAVRSWRRREGAHVPLEELLLRVVPESTGPATTLRSLAPELARIGPATAALGAATEQGRFVPGGEHAVRRPRWVLWRALRRDTGMVRATRLLVFGAPRRDSGRVAGVLAVDGEQALRDTASVAPPPR